MWQNFVENKKSITAILSKSIPDLDNIILHEFRIVSGEDIQIFLRFDVKGNEINFPKKWIEKEYNTLQVTLLLIATKMNYFNIEYLKNPNGKFLIHELDGLKIIRFESPEGECIFEIEAKWIFENAITGYKNEEKID